MSEQIYPLLKFHNCQIKELPTNNSQSLVLEDLSQKRYFTQSGNDSVINCQYFGLNQSELLTLLNFYKLTNGSLLSFTIPNELFSEIDKTVLTAMNIINIKGIWRFNTAIEVRTTVTEVYDADFDLKGVTE